MKTPATILTTLLATVTLCLSSVTLHAADAITLPSPQKTGGAPLMDALAKRATSRAFDTTAPDLTPQELSNLLWAAFGINRPDGKRTAPSALNFQEVDIYVLLKQGAFIYDAKKHELRPVGDDAVKGQDARSLGGTQAFVKNAQLTLVYVTDLSRMGRMGEGRSPEEAAAFCIGAISQNTALYCASEGLLTGVRMSIDRTRLGAALGLRNDQWISLAQSVGRDTQPQTK